jgi:hypothetical protein
MHSGPPQKAKAALKNPLLYTSLALGVALLYVGWIFFGRWQENRALEQRAAEKRRAADQQTVESLGGKRLEIQSFYASPGMVRRGETVQLCYGVANAKKVTLEPPVGPVWPSYSRCLDVSPTKDTTYTLTVEDGQGNSKSATLTIRVR